MTLRETIFQVLRNFPLTGEQLRRAVGAGRSACAAALKQLRDEKKVVADKTINRKGRIVPLYRAVAVAIAFVSWLAFGAAVNLTLPDLNPAHAPTVPYPHVSPSNVAQAQVVVPGGVFSTTLRWNITNPPASLSNVVVNLHFATNLSLPSPWPVVATVPAVAGWTTNSVTNGYPTGFFRASTSNVFYHVGI